MVQYVFGVGGQKNHGSTKEQGKLYENQDEDLENDWGPGEERETTADTTSDSKEE